MRRSMLGGVAAMQSRLLAQPRWCSSRVANDATNTSMKELMDAFGEARELIGDARESIGTVYFADDLNDAIKAKDDVLSQWKQIQDTLESEAATDRRVKLQKEYDVKFRQLQAEVEELMAHDD